MKITCLRYIKYSAIVLFFLKINSTFSRNDSALYLFITDKAILDSKNIVLSFFREKKIDFLDISCCNNNVKLKKLIYNKSPSHIIFVGDFIMNYPDDGKFHADYFFSFDNDSLNPNIIVSRLPFHTKLELNNYLTKYITFKNDTVPKKGVVTYDAYNNLNRFNKVFSKSTIIIDSQSWNLVSKVKHKLFKHKNIRLVDIINNNNPSYFIYFGHGSSYGWESDNQLNEFTLKKLKQGQFYYNIDFSCSTGKWYETNDCYSEKMLKLPNSGSICYISSISKINILESNCLYNNFMTNFDQGKSIGENFLNFQKNAAQNCSYSTLEEFVLLGIPF